MRVGCSLVSFLGFVFSLLGSHQKRVVTSAEFRLQIRPGPMERACSGTTLVYLFQSQVVKLVLKFACKLGSNAALFQEESLNTWILDLFSAFSEALLSVVKCFERSAFSICSTLSDIVFLLTL